MASTQSLSLQKKKVDEIMEEYIDIFSSPTEVLKHCQVKNLIDLTLDAPLPNGPVYCFSLMENDKIRHQFQVFLQKGFLQKGHITSNSSPCEILIVMVQTKDKTWRLYIDYRSLKKKHS